MGGIIDLVLGVLFLAAFFQLPAPPATRSE